MIKNKLKITNRLALILLAIIISGLLNICLFSLQAKAAEPMPMPKFNFVSDESGNCLAEPMPEPTQNISLPSAPLPQCCLAQNRNFNAVVNTANDKSAAAFTSLAISPQDIPKNENFSAQYASRPTYPPPEALALATTIIRE